MGFKETVLITAFLIVLSLMLLISSVLNKGIHVVRPDSCPDYWTTLNRKPDTAECMNTKFGCCNDYATPKNDVDGSKCPVKCYNVHQLGKASAACTSIPTEIDFGTTAYKGSGGLCAKQKWAKQCDITWDGVTNVKNAC
jgi:hypothetical protein